MLVNKNIVITFIYLLFAVTSQSQQVVWKKAFIFSDISSSSSIIYSKSEGRFIFAGGADSSASIGKINTMGDTTFFKNDYQQFETLGFGIWDIGKTPDELGYYAKTVLFDPITWNEENNITRFGTDGNIMWRTSYNVGYDDWYKSFKVLPDGSAFITGYRGNPQNDLYLVSINREGSTQFENQYYENGFQFNYESSIFSDGSLVTYGRERPFSTFSYSPFLVKFDSDGNLIKKDTLPNLIATDSAGAPHFISETGDGHLLFEWLSQNERYIIKTDTNYNIIWQTPPDQKVGSPVLLDNSTVFTFWNSRVKLYDYGTGGLLWSVHFPDTLGGQVVFQDYAFDDSGSVVLSGYVYENSQNQHMYFAKISNIGKPATFDCNNGAIIDSMYANVQGTSFLNLGAAASEFLKYSDVLAYNWYLQDGTHLYGQYQSHNFDNVAFPDTFWCMLVVTDAIGCSDTLTLNAYTGDTLANPNWPLPDAVDEEMSSNNSFSVYPNPFDDRITIQFSQPIPANTPVQVFDVIGRSYKVPVTYSAHRLVIDGEKLPQGMYVVVLDKHTTFKVVKQ